VRQPRQPTRDLFAADPIAKDLQGRDIITPTQYLLSVAPLWEAQYSIEASKPTAKEARLLGIDPQEPCLVIVRRTESQGAPVTLARLVHPGTRYTLEGSFKP